MTVLKKIIFFIGIGVMLMQVVACGRYSEPVPVEGSGYPRTYPRR